MTNPTQDTVDFLQTDKPKAQIVTRKCRVKKRGMFGSANTSVTNSLDTITDATETFSRTVKLANLQLKAVALEMELDVYEDIMERGYTLEEAKAMLAAV